MALRFLLKLPTDMSIPFLPFPNCSHFLSTQASVWSDSFISLCIANLYLGHLSFIVTTPLPVNSCHFMFSTLDICCFIFYTSIQFSWFFIRINVAAFGFYNRWWQHGFVFPVCHTYFFKSETKYKYSQTAK